MKNKTDLLMSLQQNFEKKKKKRRMLRLLFTVISSHPAEVKLVGGRPDCRQVASSQAAVVPGVSPHFPIVDELEAGRSGVLPVSRAAVNVCLKIKTKNAVP
jgi:hypothetical protein